MNKSRKWKRIINKLTNKKYYLHKYKLKDYIRILNIVECEAHRELLINGLKNKIKELTKNGN